jgi:hypothetical protein
MGFFRSLFLGSSNKSNSKKSLKKGSGAYESTVALEPPVKGSFPVAGNGNVEESLQRAKIRRDSRQSNSRASSFVGINPTFRTSTTTADRPRTVPHNGFSGGQFAADLAPERTRTGFSMREPPNTLSDNRRNSLRSAQSPPPTIPLPSLPSDVSRYVPTYQPKRSTNATPVSDAGNISNRDEPPAPFIPPYAASLHQRNFSQASHSSHVDVLEAYSTMRPKEVSKHKVKASGLRIYGEDVADRNIADFGDRELAKLDLNSPEFGYMKSVYAGKKRHGNDDVAQQFLSDDTHKTTPPTSRFSTTTLPTGDIPPPIHNHTIGLEQNSSSTQYVTSHSQRSGPPSMSKQEQIPIKISARNDISPSQLSQQSHSIGQHPPVDPSQRASSYSQPRATSASTHVQPSSTQSPLRTSSTPDATTTSGSRPSSSHARTVSRGSYSAFPSTTSPRSSSYSSPTSPNSSRPMAAATAPRKLNYVIEGAREAPSLEGVINLGNSEQTHKTVTTLPGTYISPTYTSPASTPRTTLSRPASSVSMRSSFSANRYASYLEPPLAQLPARNISSPNLQTFKPGIWPLPQLHNSPRT